MEMVFSKQLTDTDIQKRLAIPTDSLEHFEFHADNRKSLQVVDENGKTWLFVCATRKGNYRKPAFCGGWRGFVRFTKLRTGDRVEFYKDTEGLYRIQVQRRRSIRLFGQEYWLPPRSDQQVNFRKGSAGSRSKEACWGTEQGFDSAELIELDGDPNNYQQNQSQHLSLSKSACSSTSETSKNSGLSLSRSEIRVNSVKASEPARERAAKEKEKEHESRIAHHQNVNPISQNSPFTELLTGGIGSVGNNNASPSASAYQNPNGAPGFFHKDNTARQWPGTQMDYFTTGRPCSSSESHHSSGFPGQIQLRNSLPQSMSIRPFNVSGENHEELQYFSFVPNPDHLIPVATTQPGPGGDYNLNFTISSQLAGFRRGPLQSILRPLPHHLQRFSSIDGSSRFYTGTPLVENHYHH